MATFAAFVFLAAIAVSGQLGIAFLLLRHHAALLEGILEHLTNSVTTEVVGGEPRDLIKERLELEKRKLAMEEEKHRMLMRRVAEQRDGQEPWSS